MATRTNFAGDFLKRQYTAVVTRKTRTDQTSDHQAENPSVRFHSGISLSGYNVSVKEATCLHARKIILSTRREILNLSRRSNSDELFIL